MLSPSFSPQAVPPLTLRSETYLFDPRPYLPLVSTVNRFIPSSAGDDKEGLTLIFLHGTNFNKEQWDPTIEELVKILASQRTSTNDPNGKGTVHIRELWTIDFPNHGDAAVLNEETLQWGYEPTFSWEEYSRVLHAFLAGNGSLRPFDTSNCIQPLPPVGVRGMSSTVPYSFASHRLVIVGHSVGAIAGVLTLDQFPSVQGAQSCSLSSPSSSSSSTLRSLILFEPMTLAPHHSDPCAFAPPSDSPPRPSVASIGPGSFLILGSVARRDTWPSREDAYMTLKRRQPYKSWDDRVLRKFVDHGLRPLPTLEHPELGVQGMTLKCTKKQETATYSDRRGSSTSYRNFGSYVKRARIHVVYGTKHDIITADAKRDLIENAIGGAQNLASLEWVQGASHSIPQTHPRACAEKIFGALVLDAEHEHWKQREAQELRPNSREDSLTVVQEGGRVRAML